MKIKRRRTQPQTLNKLAVCRQKMDDIKLTIIFLERKLTFMFDRTADEEFIIEDGYQNSYISNYNITRHKLTYYN